MAFRLGMSVRLAITGPRSEAVVAPQRSSWKRPRAALGCEERTMWSDLRCVVMAEFLSVA